MNSKLNSIAELASRKLNLKKEKKERKNQTKTLNYGKLNQGLDGLIPPQS